MSKKSKHARHAKNKEKLEIEKQQEENEIKEEKVESQKVEGKKQEEKKVSKLVWIVVAIITIIEAVYGANLLYQKYGPKFQDTQVEIGTDKAEITANTFLKDKSKEGAILLSSLDEIDFGKVGEYPIKLSYEDREEEVLLKLVDTTKPEVTFQDLTKYIDYEINPDDFIVEKSDLSEMTVSIKEVPELDHFGEYTITVLVTDSSGNVTSGDCKLSVEWLKRELAIEKGDKISKESLLYNVEADGDLIDSTRLKEIENSDIGDYELTVEREGVSYTVKIKVTDLTPPTLELKDVSIYDDETADKSSFIVKATDASGEVKTILKTAINLKKIGVQEVTIEAVDKYGNSAEKTATLTIKKDTVGPVISGISEMTVAKGSSVDFRKGVSSKDAKDGACEFEVNSSSVDLSKAGTYYATYTSSDTKGNKTTSKRKVTVRHNKDDENALVKEIASGLGSSVEELRDYCQTKIKYNTNYGNGEPVWYGFNEWKGNCYVHAYCLKALLDQKGYQNQIIWVTDKSHYWNLVKINGVWRHVDSTPSSQHRQVGIGTDDVRLATLSGRDWDHSAWPAAN